MALDFPTTPANGFVYTSPTGEQWVYETATTSWTSKGLVNSSGGIKYVGTIDIAAAPPTGVTGGALYIVAADGTANAGFGPGVTGALTKGDSVMNTGAGWIKLSHPTSAWLKSGTNLAPTATGDVVSISAGTAALPGLTPVGDPNTGIYAPAADQLAISTGGVQRLLVTDTGLIGIGSPAATAASRLAVNDPAVSVANDALPTMQVYRRGIGSGGSGATEIGLDVSVAQTHNANGATGIRVHAKSGVDSVPAYAIDASVVAKNNGTARAARFTGGHSNTAGSGIQHVVDVIATVTDTGTNGGVFGLYVEMPDYDGTVNTALRLNNKNVGTAKQNTVRIDRNAVNLGTIYTTDTDFGIYGKNNLKLDVGASTRAHIDSTGKLLVGPNLAAIAAGGILQLAGGITFPATAVASTDPNTLDDYEEGTWTPSAITDCTVSLATYVKVGKSFAVSCTYTNTGAATVTFPNFITGLPFAALRKLGGVLGVVNASTALLSDSAVALTGASAVNVNFSKQISVPAGKLAVLTLQGQVD